MLDEPLRRLFPRQDHLKVRQKSAAAADHKVKLGVLRNQ